MWRIRACIVSLTPLLPDVIDVGPWAVMKRLARECHRVHRCRCCQVELRPAAYLSKERKSCLKRIVNCWGWAIRGHSGGYPGRCPGPKTFSAHTGEQEVEFSAETSSTKRGGCPSSEGVSERINARNFGLIFRSPIQGGQSTLDVPQMLVEQELLHSFAA